jgi:hypothetical protein
VPVAGFVGNIYNIVGILRFIGKAGLEIQKLIVVAIADLVGGGLFIEVGVSRVKPGRECSGTYSGEGG